jgi:hypothetical protein
MSLASSPTRRQRDVIHVARLLGSGLSPRQVVLTSGLHPAQALATVRRLRHLRLPPFVLREVLALSPAEQFPRAMLHLLLCRRWEQRARVKAARRAGKAGGA